MLRRKLRRPIAGRITTTVIGKVSLQVRRRAQDLALARVTRTPMIRVGRAVLAGMAMAGELDRNTGQAISPIDSPTSIGKFLIAGRITSFRVVTGIAHKARVTSWFSRPMGYA